jgi:NADH-quinone oxidoreductase subunit L
VEALRSQFPASDFTLLAIVLALPALGAFVNGVFGRRIGKKGVRLMALAAIGGAFLASLATLLLLALGEGGEGGRLTWTAWRWFTLTGRMGQTVPVDVAFSVDAMSAVMMLVVTGVGFLIHLYSTEYMRKDDGYHRFFAYLNLFCFAMLVLITADNMAVLFVGWEGVGLCSYLLIGFWFTEEKNAAAGKKAFIVNRIGDFGLIVAMAMIVYYTSSLRWTGIEAGASNLISGVKIWPVGNLSHETLPAFVADLIIPAKPVTVYASTLVGLAIFLGCAGKSAQIPLYVWLPDAMAGPTPVSALIHAATMVTAGVYLVARLSFVFVLSPAAMATVAVAGAATAFFAATIGMLQTDLKKVLAYSTVSQLGFMFIGVGVGAFAAGFFHVFTHAFFKACLFLCAGSVIHAMHARVHDTERSQDMRRMGGLAPYLPITRWTFFIACLAIAGVPPFAGFWSKDEILWKAFSSRITTDRGTSDMPMWTWPGWLGPALYWVGIAAATMTAFYMFRAYFMTFHGKFRGWKIVRGWKDHGHHDAHDAHDDRPLEGPAPKESPPAMTIPLVVLASFAVFAGFLNANLTTPLGAFHSAPVGHLLEPVFAKAERMVAEREGVAGIELLMMVPGLLAFIAGALGAFVVYYQRGGAPERAFAEGYPRFYKLVYDKWRIDELYDAAVVGMVDALADIFVMADTWIVDGVLARLSAFVVGGVGTGLRALQTGRVQAYSAFMVIGLAGVGWFMVRPHADAQIDETNLRQSGEVKLTAAPGLGYRYHWEQPGKAVTDGPDLTLKLQPGESEEVVLEVENAFNSKARHVIPLTRPSPGKKPTVIEVPRPAPPSGAPAPPHGVPARPAPKGGAQ